MKIKGTITYVPLSGGFWGIVAENGDRFLPTGGLPDEFKEEGLPIAATVKKVNVFSIFMWGTSVEVKTIKKLNK